MVFIYVSTKFEFCKGFFSSILKRLHICSFSKSRHDWYSKFKHKFINQTQVLSFLKNSYLLVLWISYLDQNQQKNTCTWYFLLKIIFKKVFLTKLDVEKLCRLSMRQILLADWGSSSSSIINVSFDDSIVLQRCQIFLNLFGITD